MPIKHPNLHPMLATGVHPELPTVSIKTAIVTSPNRI